MFKKNDRVIVVNKLAFFPDGYEIGDFATVKKDQTSGTISVTFDKGFINNSYGVYASQFELVTPATLQDVVDTIQEFARALVTPPTPIAGQVWSHKKTKRQIHIICVHDKYIWVRNKAGFNPSPFTLNITLLWEKFTYASDS